MAGERGPDPEVGISHPRFNENREKLFSADAEIIFNQDRPGLEIQNLEADAAITLAYGFTMELEEGGYYSSKEEEGEFTMHKARAEGQLKFIRGESRIFYTSPDAGTFRVTVEKISADKTTLTVETDNPDPTGKIQEAYMAVMCSSDLPISRLPSEEGERREDDSDWNRDVEELVDFGEDFEERAELFLGDDEVFEEFLDDESNEDVRKTIASDLRKRLHAYGIKKVGDQDRLINLWRAMEMDAYLIDDLALFATHTRRLASKDGYAMPNFQSLEDRAEIISENPYDMRSIFIDEFAENLTIPGIGYSEEEARKLCKPNRTADPRIHQRARAFRFLSWLLPQDFMAEFPGILKAEMQEKGNDRVRPSTRLFTLAREEVQRQLRNHRLSKMTPKKMNGSVAANETPPETQVEVPASIPEVPSVPLETPKKYLYDSRVKEDIDDYLRIEAVLESALDLCDYMFTGQLK
jgi:hypothetical protein